MTIGRNILGDEASVERISRDMVLDFVKHNYFPNRMVISSVGDISFEKLVRLVEKYFSPYESGSPLRTRIKPEIYVPRFVELDKDTHQSHCIIGNVAYDYTEDNPFGPIAIDEFIRWDRNEFPLEFEYS